MSKTESKLHGLTWAPARRFALVVHYEMHEGEERSTWSEGWRVVAFDADGDPIVVDKGLTTVAELLERYTDNDRYANVSWAVDSAENHPAGEFGVRRVS